MKLKSFCLVVFCFLSSFSQEKHIIIYDIYPTFGSIENSEDNNDKALSFIYEGVDNALKELKYKMEFNSRESTFKIIDIIPVNKKAYRLAKSYSGNEEYYCNKNLDYKIRVKSFFNNEFFIKDTVKYSWKIYNEKKLIGNKECYKATTSKKVVLKTGLKEYEVTAWFCEDIPGFFGPKGFNGLPGLILELIDDKVTFVANRIEKVYGNDNIEFNKNKDLISEEKYNEIVKEKVKDFFENKK